ncbi:MAG TPA: branched-chain amino acid ABC transporter permease [Acidimicrobiales bacterium]|nr:branched-chain amino acid ABC transporter permease [Acidimicrobiales bacterium]
MGAFGHYLAAHFDTLRLEFWRLFVGGVANGLLYGMIAVGYTLVYGVLRLINFAHSEIFMSGGFAGYFVMRALVGSGAPPAGFASVGLIMLGILAGGTAGAVMATLLERVAYRPLRKRNAPKLAYLISAIGASYFLFNLAGKEFGHLAVSTPQPYINGIAFHVFGAPVQMYFVIIFIVGLIMFVGLDRLISKSKLGRGIRAVAQDAETASLMGVNIDRTIAITFIVGGTLGGAAGFLFGLGYGVVYTMGFVPALKAFTAAVLGGIGNLRGAMIGGLILGIFESLSVVFVQAAYIDVVAFGILVLVLLVRPTGILGERLGRAA